MKKTLLAIVMLPAMFAVGAANAAFVVSPDNNFNGSLDFNGTITDTAPNWSWEIPAASTALAKDWTAEKIKGIADAPVSVYAVGDRLLRYRCRRGPVE